MDNGNFMQDGILEIKGTDALRSEGWIEAPRHYANNNTNYKDASE